MPERVEDSIAIHEGAPEAALGGEGIVLHESSPGRGSIVHTPRYYPYLEGLGSFVASIGCKRVRETLWDGFAVPFAEHILDVVGQRETDDTRGLIRRWNRLLGTSEDIRAVKGITIGVYPASREVRL